jgi:hypothetical protein
MKILIASVNRLSSKLDARYTKASLVTHKNLVRHLRPCRISFRQLLRRLVIERAPACIVCADYAPEVVAPPKAASITKSICNKCKTDQFIMCSYCGHEMAWLDKAGRVFRCCPSCVSSTKRRKCCCVCRRQKQTHAKCGTHDLTRVDSPKTDEVHALTSPEIFFK